MNKTPIGEQRFIVLDTETTGNNTSEDRPIEIAAVEWKNGVSGEMKQWFVDPQMPIKPSACAVHHITQDDIAGAEVLESIKSQVVDFVGDSPLIIHNSSFDLAMLPFFADHPVICSLRFARHIWEKGAENQWGEPLQSHKAQEIRYWLGLVVDTGGLSAHRAGADILVCGHIFQAEIDKYLETGGENNTQALIDFVKAPVKYAVFPHGIHAGTTFDKLPQSFVDYYLNPVRNKNPDPDLFITIKTEQKRRMAMDDQAKDAATVLRKMASGGSFRPFA